MKIIGHVYTDFPSKFGIPRQSGLVEALKGKIIFESEFHNPQAFRGLESFSQIWILWGYLPLAPRSVLMILGFLV